MSTVNIKFSALAPTVRGLSEAEYPTISFVPTSKSYPAYSYTQEWDDFVTAIQVPARSTTGEPEIAVGGGADLRDLKIVSGPLLDGLTGEFKLNGGHVETMYGANGPRTVTVEVSNRYTARQVDIAFTFGGSTAADVQQVTGVEYKTGTLGKEIVDTTTAAFPENPASNELNCQFLEGGVYSAGACDVQDNPYFMFKGFDWSGISLARTGAGYNLPYVLVSPRHVVFAAHIRGNSVGDTVTFRRQDGSYQSVTVLSEARLVTGDPATSPDLAVAYLSEAVTGCAPFKLPPPDYDRYFGQYTANQAMAWSGVPTVLRASNPGTNDTLLTGRIKLTRDAPKFLLCSVNPRVSDSVGNAVAIERVPLDTKLAGHYRAIYAGDSGSPHFWLVREAPYAKPTPVLISVLHATTGFSHFGPHLGFHALWIEDRMEALSLANGDTTVYKPTYANFTRFKKFA